MAYNHELDHNLNMDMFSDDGNVVPISTSYRNERAIEYLASSQPNINMGPRGDTPEAVYTNLPRNGPSWPEGHDNGTRDSDVAVDNNKTSYREDDNGRDTIDVHERAPVNNNLDKPDIGIPVYSKVDMSKKNRKTSDDSVFNPYPSIELDTDDDIDEEDISEVPYPDEDLPPMERTWTNVSEFNFPPPPNDPPPEDPEVPNISGASARPTDNGPVSHEDPYEEVTAKTRINKEPKALREKGPKKRRMLAAWAEDDDEPMEPMGNLWEAVDKELDRRLGYT